MLLLLSWIMQHDGDGTRLSWIIFMFGEEVCLWFPNLIMRASVQLLDDLWTVCLWLSAITGWFPVTTCPRPVFIQHRVTVKAEYTSHLSNPLRMNQFQETTLFKLEPFINVSLRVMWKYISIVLLQYSTTLLFYYTSCEAALQCLLWLFQFAKISSVLSLM